MNANSHKQVAGAYSGSAERELSTRQIMVRLLRALIGNTERAKSFQRSKQFEDACNENIKSIRILAVIRSSLKPEMLDTEDQEVLKIADYLSRLYRYIFIRLANIPSSRHFERDYDFMLRRYNEQLDLYSQETEEPVVASEASIVDIRQRASASDASTGHAETPAAGDIYA